MPPKSSSSVAKAVAKPVTTVPSKSKPSPPLSEPTKRKQPSPVEEVQPEPVKRQKAAAVTKKEVKEEREVKSPIEKSSKTVNPPATVATKSTKAASTTTTKPKSKSAVLFKEENDEMEFDEQSGDDDDDGDDQHVVLPPPKQPQLVTKSTFKDSQLSTSKQAATALAIKPAKVKVEDPDSFAASPLVDETKKSLKAMSLTTMNPLQKAAMMPLLQGRDALIISGPNTGKTLTALLPGLQLMIETGFKQRNFTGILLLTPTREKALLTYKMVADITQANSGVTHGLLLGNTNPFIQFQKLQKGVGIVVATPQRALEQMKTRGAIWHKNIMSVIIDDCDVMNELNCDAAIIELIQLLDPLRHTTCTSSSNTRAVQKIAKATMKKPLLIGSKATAVNDVTGSIVPKDIDEKQFKNNNERNKEIFKQAVANFDKNNKKYIKNGYITIPTTQRFNVLYTVLKKTLLSKQIVFVQTPDEVIHLVALFRQLDIIPLALHEQLNEQQRAKAFFEFQNAQKGALMFVTELSLRGLKFTVPIDTIYHYDIPVTPLRYLERLAHFPAPSDPSARMNSVIFILEENEVPLSEQLTSKLTFTSFSHPPLINIYKNVNKMIESNFFLHTSATKAFFAFMRYYVQYSTDGGQYDLKSLDNVAIARSFGLEHPPAIKTD